MKRFLTAVLTMAAVISLTACGKDDGGGSAPTFPTSGTGAAEASQTVKPQSSAPSAQSSSSSAQSSSPSAQSSSPSAASQTSAAGESSGGTSKPSKPQTVESRTYKRRPIDEYDNDDVYLIVEILDNGGWYLSSDTWAGQTYASYSFEEEAAGAYVPIVGYGAGAEPNLVGEAKFTMTEDVLTVQYDDADSFTAYDRYN